MELCVGVTPNVKFLKQLFHLPQETSRLETDAPESICLLDLEVSTLSYILNVFKCYFLFSYFFSSPFFSFLLFLLVSNFLVVVYLFSQKQVFLLRMVFTSNLELQEKFNTRNETHQPPFLLLLLCKQCYTEKQTSWWDAVHILMQKKNNVRILQFRNIWNKPLDSFWIDSHSLCKTSLLCWAVLDMNVLLQ